MVTGPRQNLLGKWEAWAFNPLKEIKIGPPKTRLFAIKVILSWKQLRNSKHKQSPSPLLLEGGCASSSDR